MPWRIEMGTIVGRELHLLDRPALPVRQILGLQSLEELQHARQPLLVIDILDRGMSSWRIGRHVVLQRHGDIDQSSGHKRCLEGFCCALSTCRVSGVLALDSVFQDPDFFDVKLDGIAVLKKPAEFDPAAVANSA